MIVATKATAWTRADDEIFREMVEANAPPDIIAGRLNRSVDAIKRRAYVIGLPRKWFKRKRPDRRLVEIGLKAKK